MKATFAFITMIMDLTFGPAVAQEKITQAPKLQDQLTAENCKPQPDCRIFYPSIQPGASRNTQILGGANSIVRDPLKGLNLR